MRPLTLRIKGFTSFRDEQIVDFTDLDLFALWGPTGSGKSSVLDALTYALYGKVDRVEHASELVSQGRPRMSVSFDFSADGRAYRIARSMPPTKVRLEKLDESGQWKSFGPGADNVPEVNRSLIELVGLDYLAFTRSVLLPQGKFAEFLVGEAPKRRKILTELLGLELFDQMAKRANVIKKDESDQADMKRTFIERHFEGVDAGALTNARLELKRAETQAGRMSKVLTEVQKHGERLNELRVSTTAIIACRKETTSFTSAFEKHALQLETLARTGTSFKGELEEATEGAAAASESLEGARKKRMRTEKHWGTLDALATMSVRADNLAEAAATTQRVERSLTDARAQTKQLARQIETGDKAVEGAVAAARKAAAEVERRQAATDEAHRHDHVGSLVHGLTAGEPCPVCERPLKAIPRFDPTELEATATALDNANAAHARATKASTEAMTTQAVARKEHATATDHVMTFEQAAEEARAKHSAISNELARAFGKLMPADPAAELNARTNALKELIEIEARANEAEDAAMATLGALDERRRELHDKTGEIRTRMDSNNLPSALERVAAAAPDIELPDLAALTSLPTAPEALAGEAEQIAKAMHSLESDLDDALRQRKAEFETLTETMLASVPAEFDVSASDSEALLNELRGLEKSLATSVALAAKEASALKEKLKQRKELEDEIALHCEQAAVYSDLQKELRNDRIVQHLQAEALVALADGASHHLRDLSDSRYRLVFDKDRFYVVDAWNGDEKRNVKTLSGGETFLTSLALALALSEQIQVLSVTEKSRLESLFLDEGFGQLDAERLEPVVDAIERMRAADRLVGIITHIPELAERMPVRLEVTMSPRGSTIHRSVSEVGLAPPA